MASATSQRSASVSRETKETAISVAVDIDGAGRFGPPLRAILLLARKRSRKPSGAA